MNRVAPQLVLWREAKHQVLLVLVLLLSCLFRVKPHASAAGIRVLYPFKFGRGTLSMRTIRKQINGDAPHPLEMHCFTSN